MTDVKISTLNQSIGIGLPSLVFRRDAGNLHTVSISRYISPAFYVFIHKVYFLPAKTSLIADQVDEFFSVKINLLFGV